MPSETPREMKPVMLLIAGFGDNASMFDGLRDTALADRFDLRPLDLPGFGAPPPAAGATLSTLADFVARRATETRA